MSATSSQAPPHIIAATEQLKAAIRAVDRREIDEQSTPWLEIEKSVIKLLGGPFRIERPDHQVVALGLAGIYAARLIKDQQAFWFPNREALEGAALGFPAALLVVSPFGSVAEALSRANLSKLDDFAKEVGTSLAQARFSAVGAPAVTKLSAEDYQRIFDPSFVQFLAIDLDKAKTTWDSTVSQLIAEVRDGFTRAGGRLPADARTLLENRIIAVLQRLDPTKKLREQADKAPRVFELMTHLCATVAASGLAPEEFWDGVVFPLLHIGVPGEFPPVEPGDLAAFGKGMDPLLLFVDLIPYRTSAPEEGLLGAFHPAEISVLDPAIPPTAALRLVKLDPKRLEPILAAFDPAALRAVVKRFTAHLEQKLGKPATAETASSPLLEPALNLAGALKGIWSGKGGSVVCMRNLTEAEAALEPALGELRKVLQGPRIILL
jgi:hypothetical protein